MYIYIYIYTYVYITIALLTSLKRMFSREWRSSKCKNPLEGICQCPMVYSFSFLKELWQLNKSDTAPVLYLAVPQTAHRRCSWKPANLVLRAPTGYLQATRFGLTSGFGSKTIYIPREPKTAEKSNPVKKHDVSEKKTGSVQKDGYFQITHHFLAGFYG